jgi:ABC-2 type transport system permease protein
VNIFLRELKAQTKSLLIWTLILAFLILIAVAKFAGFVDNPEMLALLDSIPPAMLEALDMNAFNLTTISGFFGLMFLYFSLIGAMAAVMWGSNMIAKEERDRTVEFSLVLPVSRSRLVAAKALAGLVCCVLLVLITWGFSVVSVQSYQPDAEFYTFLALEMLAMLFIEIIFLAIGLLLGCAMPYHKRTGTLAVGIILLTYFLSIVADLNEKMVFLKYFTPFKYFTASEILSTGGFEGVSIGLMVGITLLCVGVAFWAYNRRDLYI